MKILFLSPFDRALHKGGGAAYSQSLVDMLGRPPLGAEVDELWPNRLTGGVRGLRRRLLQFFSVAGSLVSALPAKALFLYSRKFVPMIHEALARTNYDMIIINGGDLLWVLEAIPSQLPVILLAHNIESKLYRSQINSLRVPRIAKSLMLRDCRKLERYENTGLRKVRHVVSISNDDADYVRALNPGAHVLRVPPTFLYPPAERKIRRAEKDGLLEVGMLAKYGWWPNREGARWFLDEVFPHVRPKIRLHLFGQESERFDIGDPHIRVHGFVPDIRDVWPICDFTICPMFSGGGVNVKFAESLYNGVPVLATAFSARGLDIPPDPSVVLLNRARDWIEFLLSPAAAALAARTVPGHIGQMFTLGSHLGRVHEFVRAAAERPARETQARPV
ncbi:MAG: glycosyltransferase [Alphaproteobacteria bacterium]